MAYIVLGSLNQLQLQIPTEGTKDWGNNLKDNFVIKIVEHDHSGNGKGAPLGINSFADNIVNDIKIRLRNDQFLRSRNSTNTGDVNLIKANASNNLVIGDNTAGQVTTISSATTTVNALTVSGALIIPPASIGTDEVENDSITNDKMAANSISETELQDNSIPQSKLQDASVGTNELIDLNVTTAKLAANAVDDTKVRLRNNQWFKGRNAADNADINIVKVNAANVIEFGGSVTATPAVNSVGTAELKDGEVTAGKLAVGAALGNIVDNTIPKSKLVDSVLSVYNYSSDQSKTISPGVTVDLTFSDINNDTLNITSNIITFKKQGYYRVVLNLGYTLSSGVFTNPTNYTLTALGTGSSSDSQIRNAARVSHTVTGGSGLTLPTSSMDVVTSTINTTLRYTLLVSWSPGIATHNTLNFRPILTIIYLGI